MTADSKTRNKGAILLVLAALYISLIGIYAGGVPAGAGLTNISHDTGPAFTPANRTDAGGTINTVNLNSNQQNPGWKAYVGNVSGTLTLDDANQNTIYNWSLSSITGEMYVSRDNNVDWNNIQCANSTTIGDEQTVIGGSGTDDDSINNTYDQSLHPNMQVGENAITNSTCRTAYTFQADSSQSASENANFTAILLQDSTPDLVYASFLEQDAQGFDSATYDFQIIVPDPDNANTTTYYFYLELGS